MCFNGISGFFTHELVYNTLQMRTETEKKKLFNINYDFYLCDKRKAEKSE